jgi:hypothetical protein
MCSGPLGSLLAFLIEPKRVMQNGRCEEGDAKRAMQSAPTSASRILVRGGNFDFVREWNTRAAKGCGLRFTLNRREPAHRNRLYC